MTSNDDWDAAFTADPDTDADDTATAEHAESGPRPFFPDVETWVRDWLAPVIARPQPSSMAWCPEWWRHAEAISRLEALWRAWENLRLDGTTGMSTWWRDHFDPHWRALTDVDTSPFADCHNGHKDTLEPLSVVPAPDGWWGPPADELEPEPTSEPQRN